MDLFLLIATIIMFISSIAPTVRVGTASINLFYLAWAFALLSLVTTVKV